MFRMTSPNIHSLVGSTVRGMVNEQASLELNFISFPRKVVQAHRRSFGVK